MRDINEIIIHCADTRVNQSFSIKDVRGWHLQRGFNDVGYHYYIRLKGAIEYGRDIATSGAHVRGRNSNSIGICFEGGKNQDGSMWDRPTDEQIKSYKKLKESLFTVLGGEIPVNGHRKYSSKTCPNFDVKILES